MLHFYALFVAPIHAIGFPQTLSLAPLTGNTGQKKAQLKDYNGFVLKRCWLVEEFVSGILSLSCSACWRHEEKTRCVILSFHFWSCILQCDNYRLRKLYSIILRIRMLQTLRSTADRKHRERLITQLGISSRPLPSS